jgi:hypothetical protein
MFQLTSSSGLSRRIVHLFGVALIAFSAIVGMRDAAVGGFIFLLYAGGAIGGLLLVALIRRLNRAPDDSASDVFLRDNLSTDVINFSRLRVSGVGGLALVIVSAAIAISLPPVGLAVTLGLVGGVVLSFWLLGYRRQHAGRWG